MKTEFNVERVCERVHLCVVEAPDHLGAPAFEIRGGSIYVTFPHVEKIESMMAQVFGEVVAGGEKPTAIWTPEHGAIEVPNDPVAESNAQNSPEAGSIAASQSKPKKRGR